jgi:hypothetical protein
MPEVIKKLRLSQKANRNVLKTIIFFEVLEVFVVHAFLRLEPRFILTTPPYLLRMGRSFREHCWRKALPILSLRCE